MEKEKLKTFEGLFVTLKADSCFIKGKLTRVDDDTLHMNEAQVIYKPSFHETFTTPVQSFEWILVNPYKVWDCCLTYEQLSNNYTISAAGVSQL